jgi:hypothetical protein
MLNIPTLMVMTIANKIKIKAGIKIKVMNIIKEVTNKMIKLLQLKVKFSHKLQVPKRKRRRSKWKFQRRTRKKSSQILRVLI